MLDIGWCSIRSRYLQRKDVPGSFHAVLPATGNGSTGTYQHFFRCIDNAIELLLVDSIDRPFSFAVIAAIFVLKLVSLPANDILHSDYSSFGPTASIVTISFQAYRSNLFIVLLSLTDFVNVRSIFHNNIYSSSIDNLPSNHTASNIHVPHTSHPYRRRYSMHDSQWGRI